MKLTPYLTAVVSVSCAFGAFAADDSKALLEDALSAAPPQLEGIAPMCMDGPWMEWADAWMNKKPFQAKALGISYMLAGDGGASNTDPFAEGMTDDNQWIVEGPHLMIITPDQALLDSLPTDPSYGGPYVMWKGTPYAHIMIPVGARK